MHEKNSNHREEVSKMTNFSAFVESVTIDNSERKANPFIEDT